MEKINSGRQLELDLAKAFVIVNLATIHTVIECSTDEVLARGAPFFFDSVLGGPLAAPMFLFAMGIGFVYTRRQDAAAFLYRGIKLAIVGFLLNVFRFLIPFVTGYLISGDREQFLEPLFYRVFGNDILQFSAVCFLFVALLKKLKIPDIGFVIIAVIMRLAGDFITGIDTGSQVLNVILAHFIAIEDSAQMVFSDFPLLNWFIIPAIGYVFGKKLISCADKKKFYLVTSLPCFIFAAVWFTRGIINAAGMFDEGQNSYYHMGSLDMLSSIASAVAFIGIYYLIIKVIPKQIMLVIVKISAAITFVYCIQWILVMWTTDFALHILRGTQLLPENLSIILGYLLGVVSVALSLFIRGKIAAKKR